MEWRKPTVMELECIIAEQGATMTRKQFASCEQLIASNYIDFHQVLLVVSVLVVGLAALVEAHESAVWLSLTWFNYHNLGLTYWYRRYLEAVAEREAAP